MSFMRLRKGVPTREEIERLFSKLPEGKYVWSVYARKEDKWALWVAPFLMAGKATVSEEDKWKDGIEGGWHWVASDSSLGIELWGSGANFAWKMPPSEEWPDTLDEKDYAIISNAVMDGFKQVMEEGLIKFVRMQ